MAGKPMKSFFRRGGARLRKCALPANCTRLAFRRHALRERPGDLSSRPRFAGCEAGSLSSPLFGFRAVGRFDVAPPRILCGKDARFSKFRRNDYNFFCRNVIIMVEIHGRQKPSLIECCLNSTVFGYFARRCWGSNETRRQNSYSLTGVT